VTSYSCPSVGARSESTPPATPTSSASKELAGHRASRHSNRCVGKPFSTNTAASSDIGRLPIVATTGPELHQPTEIFIPACCPRNHEPSETGDSRATSHSIRIASHYPVQRVAPVPGVRRNTCSHPRYPNLTLRLRPPQRLRAAREIHFNISGHIHEVVNGNRQNHVFRKREQGGPGCEEEPGD